ncbi:transcription initiation factor TFIID subunit 3 [Desmophyllum pertusum]|uniref:Transcription initiation factor TFIID subunit 3 n=1 Tax=Desmophyllum pertusum TaxID=174260 RepID=A0A9W9YVQ7_9CNID|nr:transcription initiation factor TFIID subunit 3 [Desmophyllum pertusum]
MCDGFNHGALQIAVAQICQAMGWDGLQKSTHDLLTDVLQKYLEEIAKSAHGYCQLYSRTEPNLDDLNRAFQDIGIYLPELEDFVSQMKTKQQQKMQTQPTQDKSKEVQRDL